MHQSVEHVEVLSLAVGRTPVAAGSLNLPVINQELTEADKERFTGLLISASPKLRWTALKYMRNEADAQDVLQDSYIKAMNAFSAFRGDAAFSTWMHRIVCTTALNRLTALKRKSQVEASFSSFLYAGDNEDNQSVQETNASHMDTPEELLQARQTQELIARALSNLQTELPEPYEAFHARVIEERDYAEFSAEKNLALGTTRSRVYRGREYLRDALGPLVGR